MSNILVLFIGTHYFCLLSFLYINRRNIVNKKQIILFFLCVLRRPDGRQMRHAQPPLPTNFINTFGPLVQCIEWDLPLFKRQGDQRRRNILPFAIGGTLVAWCVGESCASTPEEMPHALGFSISIRANKLILRSIPTWGQSTQPGCYFSPHQSLDTSQRQMWSNNIDSAGVGDQIGALDPALQGVAMAWASPTRFCRISKSLASLSALPLACLPLPEEWHMIQITPICRRVTVSADSLERRYSPATESSVDLCCLPRYFRRQPCTAGSRHKLLRNPPPRFRHLSWQPSCPQTRRGAVKRNHPRRLIPTTARFHHQYFK